MPDPTTEVSARAIWRRQIAGILAVAALLAGSVVWFMSLPAVKYRGAVDDQGIPHGSPGHDHDAMLEQLREQLDAAYAEAASHQHPNSDALSPQAKATAGPAPGPPPQAQVGSDGCLRGYGDARQCVPASVPGSDGMAEPVTCTALAEQFPEGVSAPDNDPAGLDSNGDGLACGEGDW